MFKLILGYFVIGIVFIIWRLFYHTLYKKSARENFIKTLKNDFLKLLAKSKKIIFIQLQNFQNNICTPCDDCCLRYYPDGKLRA